MCHRSKAKLKHSCIKSYVASYNLAYYTYQVYEILKLNYHLMKAIFTILLFLPFLQSQFDNASQFDKNLHYYITDANTKLMQIS